VAQLAQPADRKVDRQERPAASRQPERIAAVAAAELEHDLLGPGSNRFAGRNDLDEVVDIVPPDGRLRARGLFAVPVAELLLVPAVRVERRLVQQLHNSPLDGVAGTAAADERSGHHEAPVCALLAPVGQTQRSAVLRAPQHGN